MPGGLAAITAADSTDGATGAGRRLAVLIGIDAYASGIPPLRNAVRDIEAVGAVLREVYGYELRTLRNSDATRAGLRALFAALPAELRAPDRLILYFAGHGIADELSDGDGGPQGFLIPQDARRDDPSTFLAMSEVQAALAPLPCRHLLLLLDCCFAGAFRWSRTRALRVRRPTLYRERFERYLRDPAWQVITSSAHDERAADWIAGKVLGGRGDGSEHSPFAAALCAGLRGEADLRVGGQRGDGVILASELHLYLEAAFERLEQQQGRPMQKPMMWSLAGRDKGQFLFVPPGRSVELPAAAELSEENDPYRGLMLYEERHRALFFGRTAAADALCREVQAHELVRVVGASGTGKSSLVRAGLLPRLRALTPPWHILEPQRPGAAPLAMLQAVARALTDRPSPSLAAAVAGFCAAHPERPLLLFIDQAEEAVAQAPAELPAFLAQLDEARRAGRGQLHVVLTLRSDFEPYFALDGEAPGDGSGRRFLIPPMSRAELREAIEGPAAERVLFFDPPALCDRLLDEVADTPGPLPLLSFVLSEMYRASLRRPRDRTLSDADYHALGGVTGALSQRADAVYGRCGDEAERRAFRSLLLRMVVPGELVRRRVFESELEFPRPAETARAAALIKHLLDERLLVSDRDSRGRPFVEPAHDKLVMGWPQLGRFLAEDQGYLLHHALSEAARAWERGGAADQHLWDRDPLLPQAVATLRREPGRYNRQEADFVRQSLRRKRRSVALLTALGVVLLCTGIGWFLRERLSARRIKQQLLAAYEEHGRQLLLQGDPATALLWLNRAYHDGGDGPSLRFLLAQAARSQAIARPPLTGPAGAITDAVFSPDGARLLTLSSAGDAPKVWDTRSGALLDSLDGHTDAVIEAVYSPDGTRVLTAGRDHTARLWDAATGMLLDVLKHDGAVSHVAFSPDGRRLLTATAEGTLRLWAVTGELLATRAGAESATSARFTPDGAVLFERRDHAVTLWGADPARGERRTERDLQPDPSLRFGALAFSRDGAGLLALGPRNTVWRWDSLDKNQVLPISLAPEGQTSSSRWLAPGGQRVLVLTAERRLRLFELPQGTLLTELPGGPAPAGEAAEKPDVVFSPDGTRFLTAVQSGELRIFDDRGRLLAALAVPGLRHARFSTDGALVATVAAAAGDEQRVTVWEVQRGAPRVSLQLPARPSVRGRGTDPLASTYAGVPERSLEHHGRALTAEFSPDGRHFLLVSLQPGWGRFREAEVHPLAAAADGQPGVERSLSAFQSWEPMSVLSPDGALVAAPDWDSRVQLWDAASGRQLAPLRGHTEQVTAVAFSPDGRRLLSGSRDRTVRLWDLASGKPIFTFAGHRAAVRTLLLTADGRRLLSSDEDGQARYWDGESGGLLGTFDSGSRQTRGVSLSPDGKRLIIGTTSETRVWDTGSERPLRTHPSGAGYFLAASDDGRLLLQGADGVTLYGADGRAAVGPLRWHALPISTAAFSPDGTRVLTSSEDRTARLFDAASGAPILSLLGHGDGVTSAQFSADGTRIVTSSRDKTARIWDGRSGALLQTLSGHTRGLLRASPSRAATRVLTVGELDEDGVRVFDDRGRQLSARRGARFWILGAAYSPDGTRILTSNNDGVARIWDGAGSELVHALPAAPGGLASVGWSADGTAVLTAARDARDHDVRIWDAGTGRLLRTLVSPPLGSAPDGAPLGPVRPRVYQSRDGAHVVLLDESGTLRIWDGRSGALRTTLEGRQHELLDVLPSPDGALLLTRSPSHVARLWDTARGEPLGELAGHGDVVTAADWSPDGQRVVTASADRTARVFAVASRQLVLTLSGHTERVAAVRFSPDGRYVLSGSADKTARLWDARTGAALLSIDGIDEALPLVAFSADGRALATGSQGGVVKLWRLHFEQRSRDEIDDLCRCRVPFRFLPDQEAIVPSRRDPEACRRLASRR